MKITTIIIDEGHGEGNVNCSPDHSFYEWKFVREVGSRLAELLKIDGYKVVRVADERVDIPLKHRVGIANTYPRTETLYISLHTNAFGTGDWNGVSGLTVWCAEGCSMISKDLARCVIRSSLSLGIHVHNPKPNFHDFYVLKQTKMPAVLVELGFHTNQYDVTFMKDNVFKFASMLRLSVRDLVSC